MGGTSQDPEVGGQVRGPHTHPGERPVAGTGGGRRAPPGFEAEPAGVSDQAWQGKRELGAAVDRAGEACKRGWCAAWKVGMPVGSGVSGSGVHGESWEWR